MPLVYACIAPHGSDIIPQLANKKTLRAFEQTREGMLRVARDVKKARPDTIIIASPHNLRIHEHIGIVTTENSSGTLKGWNAPNKSVNLKVKCNPAMAKKLLSMANRRRLPVVGVNYGTFEGPNSDMAMDWGTLIPLWFFLGPKGSKKTKVVIVTPSREIPLKQNIEFGEVIGDLAEKSKERIVFVASADQAHAHKKNGPYGFHKAAAEYDKLVVNAIEHDDIGALNSLDLKFVENAKPDSLWQMAILSGIAEDVPLTPHLYSYQVPTYFGMICAGFERD